MLGLPISIQRDTTPTSSPVIEYFVTLGRDPKRAPFLQIWVGCWEPEWSWWLFKFNRAAQDPTVGIVLGKFVVNYYGRRS